MPESVGKARVDPGIEDEPASETRISMCRMCKKYCPIEVTVADGRAVDVVGFRDNELYRGYTCVKGRSIPVFLNSPDRLLHSLRRRPDGNFEEVSSSDAIEGIANTLKDIVRRHGPRSVATYVGTQGNGSAVNQPLINSFMKQLGSPMSFQASTLDKPGRTIAWELLGRWGAPHQGFNSPDVVLMSGINPFVNGNGGVPLGHPGDWLKNALKRGMQLIVIDPRRSDIAKRATIFLQPKPGHDTELIAAMLNVILSEELYDHRFVASETTGIEDLKRAVSHFRPADVARDAGVELEDLLLAARTFAAADRGFAVPGTGPHMSQPGTLVEYLFLCMDTICGHWMRSGDVVPNGGTLKKRINPIAQASSPVAAYNYGERSRVRGLGMSAAGMPSAALADEILLEGDGQVRALICCGGNPVAAFPDQLKTIRAMQNLELLVQIDPWMSQTARYADYVIAPKMQLEMPGVTQHQEETAAKTYATGYGYPAAYAQYGPAIVDPPPDSDLIEEWELFYEVAQNMGLQLSIHSELGTVDLDMARKPSQDELIAMSCDGSRVSLDEVKKHPGGALFPFPPGEEVIVQPKQAGWTGRLQLGNEDMMLDLESFASSLGDTPEPDSRYPYRLLSRRMMHVLNSSLNDAALNHGRGYNPAFMNPEDLADLGLAAGDSVKIVSQYGHIAGVVEPDPSLRRGSISMSHAFGGPPEDDDLFRAIGSPTGRLLTVDHGFDRYSGQPLMSNVPVNIEPMTE